MHVNSEYFPLAHIMCDRIAYVTKQHIKQKERRNMTIHCTQFASRKLRLIHKSVLNGDGCYIHNKQNAPDNI